MIKNIWRPVRESNRVAAVKEKRPILIQRNFAAWIALYCTGRTTGTLNGLPIFPGGGLFSCYLAAPRARKHINTTSLTLTSDPSKDLLRPHPSLCSMIPKTTAQIRCWVPSWLPSRNRFQMTCCARSSMNTPSQLSRKYSEANCECRSMDAALSKTRTRWRSPAICEPQSSQHCEL
jgi:hypothetical protein